jgi:hypothetical protein
VGGAVDVLAGVLDIDGDSGKVFKKDLADESGMAAGAAGGDEQALFTDEGLKGGAKGVLAKTVGLGIGGEGFGNGARLLEDLSEHGVRKGFVLRKHDRIGPFCIF